MKTDSGIARLQLLQHRLLLEKLNEVEDFTCHALLMDEARTAAQLAAEVGYGLLLFPCLFQERAEAAEAAALEGLRCYWLGLERSESSAAA